MNKTNLLQIIMWIKYFCPFRGGFFFLFLQLAHIQNPYYVCLCNPAKKADMIREDDNRDTPTPLSFSSSFSDAGSRRVGFSFALSQRPDTGGERRTHVHFPNSSAPKKKERKIIRVDIKGGGSLPQPVLACVHNYTQKGKVASFLRHGIKAGELYVQYVVVL